VFHSDHSTSAVWNVKKLKTDCKLIFQKSTADISPWFQRFLSYPALPGFDSPLTTPHNTSSPNPQNNNKKMVTLHFVPFHSVPGHFVPWSLFPWSLCPQSLCLLVTLSPGHFVLRSLCPRSFCPLVFLSPGHFVPGCFVPFHFVPYIRFLEWHDLEINIF
jgi:hypothetical protein